MGVGVAVEVGVGDGVRVPSHYESYSCELLELAITSARLNGWKNAEISALPFGPRKIYENCHVPCIHFPCQLPRMGQPAAAAGRLF